MADLMVIPIFIPHKGCPHRCIFCNQTIITEGSIPQASRQRLPGPEDLDCIVSEYLRYKGSRNRVELAFFGGNFLGLSMDEILGLLRAAAPWLERGEIQSIRCSTRPDTVTPEILEMVRPLGVSLVELGVQSMEDGVLARSRRGHTRQDTIRAVECLRASGMGVGVQLMTGLPGDTRETCLETARQAAALSPDLARIYPVLVLEGSPLAREFRKGAYQPQSLDEAVARVRDMVKILEGSGVPVVRMGLQAGEGLEDEKNLLAGPWHPAFGHLVRSALMLEKARSGLEEILETRDSDKGMQVELAVHPGSESRLRGDKNSNLKTLDRDYPGVRFQVKTDPDLSPDQVAVRQDSRI